MLESSILKTVKQYLGGSLEEGETAFDNEIITSINSVLRILKQKGVGPEAPFVVTSDAETWADFLNGDDLELVKSYVCLRVRMLFDPPQSSVLVGIFEKQIDELDWMINVMVDRFVPEPVEEV